MKTIIYLMTASLLTSLTLIGCGKKEDDNSNNYRVNNYNRYYMQNNMCVDTYSGQQVPYDYCQNYNNGYPNNGYPNNGYPNYPQYPGGYQVCVGTYADPYTYQWVQCYPGYVAGGSSCSGRQLMQAGQYIYCQ